MPKHEPKAQQQNIQQNQNHMLWKGFMLSNFVKDLCYLTLERISAAFMLSNFGMDLCYLTLERISESSCNHARLKMLGQECHQNHILFTSPGITHFKKGNKNRNKNRLQ